MKSRMAGTRPSIRSADSGDIGSRDQSRPFSHQGRKHVMYVPCPPCGINHKSFTQRELIILISAFQDGSGLVMTPRGIESRCILDILGLPPTQRKERANLRGRALANY